MFPRTPRNTGVYTCHPTFVTATSGVVTRLPAKHSKNGMRRQKIACLNGLRSEGVKVGNLRKLVIGISEFSRTRAFQ